MLDINNELKKIPSMKDWLENRRPHGRVDCGMGWYEILQDMALELEPVVKNFKKFSITGITVDFGDLRIYTQGMPDDDTTQVNAIVQKTIKKSQETCEECGGKSTNIEVDNWWMNRCDLCLNKRQNRKDSAFFYCPYIPLFTKKSVDKYTKENLNATD